MNPQSEPQHSSDKGWQNEEKLCVFLRKHRVFLRSANLYRKNVAVRSADSPTGPREYDKLGFSVLSHKMQNGGVSCGNEFKIVARGDTFILLFAFCIAGIANPAINENLHPEGKQKDSVSRKCLCAFVSL